MRTLIASVAAVLCAAAVHAQPQPAPAARPNILFIMTDDHAAHAISAYGCKVNQTPNIDRLAKEGALFTNVFVTNSICTPSRAAILTGKYAHINGVPVFNRFDGSQPTVAKLLQQARLPHRHDRQVAPRQRPDRLRLLEHPARPGRLPRPGPLHGDEREAVHRGYATDVITDLALDFLENAAEGQAVLPDVPPQGAAPAVEAERRSTAPSSPDVHDPRAGDAVRRLRRAAPTPCTRTSSASTTTSRRRI